MKKPFLSEPGLIKIDLEEIHLFSLQNQPYVIGDPVIYDAVTPIDYTKLPTLNQWLEQRKYNQEGSDLIPGLWQAFALSKRELKHNQDFMTSWIGMKEKPDKGKTTSGQVVTIFNRVINGIVTNETVEWIFNVCSPKQRDELLDNLLIPTAVYYPSSHQIDFEEKQGFKPQKNKWCIVPQDRIKDSKIADNIIIQNNINCRIKAIEYYVEKGLYSVQRLANEIVIQTNKVAYPKDGEKIFAYDFVNDKRNLSEKNIELAPLGGASKIEFKIVDDDVALLLYIDSKCIMYSGLNCALWLNEEVIKHLQSLFDVSVLKAPYDNMHLISGLAFI